MRRFYLALIAAMAFSAAFAAPQSVKDALTIRSGSVTPRSQQSLGHKSIGQLKHDGRTPMHKAPAKVSIDDLILDPAGTSVDYLEHSCRFEQGWLGGITITEADNKTNIVWGDDGKVYIKDIISSLGSGIYVEGTVVDNTITVKLPQVCYMEIFDDEMGYDEYYFYASKMQYYEDDETDGYACVEDDENFVVYNINPDGSITLDMGEYVPVDELEDLPEYIIGVCEEVVPGEDTWMYYGDFYQHFDVFNLETVTVPDYVTFEDWMLISNENLTVGVGFDDEMVYVKLYDPFELEEYYGEPIDFVLTGIVDGDMIVFPCPQYLGNIDSDLIFLSAIEWEDDSYMDGEFLEDLIFNYDADAKIMAVDNELIDVLLNLSPNNYNPAMYFENPTIRFQSAEDLMAAPEDPYVIYYEPVQYQDWLGADEGYVEWVIPNTNVNGFLLPTEDMYYNFYINGEKYTFTVENYPEFDEDMTDVPYDYQDGWDLQVLGDDFYFSLREPDIESVGLQSFYVAENGEVFASQLVTYIPEASGISSVAAGIQAVEFYNLQGQRITRPVAGSACIMRSIYADGTSTVTKIVRK